MSTHADLVRIERLEAERAAFEEDRCLRAAQLDWLRGFAEGTSLADALARMETTTLLRFADLLPGSQLLRDPEHRPTCRRLMRLIPAELRRRDIPPQQET